VLHVFFTPTAEDIAWARERTKEPAALFALVLDLKCFQKMARFCSREEIPDVVVDHVRRGLELDAGVEPDHHGAARTASRFGAYTTDELAHRPEAFNPSLRKSTSPPSKPPEAPPGSGGRLTHPGRPNSAGGKRGRSEGLGDEDQ
jgi:hypothetical protein